MVADIQSVKTKKDRLISPYSGVLDCLKDMLKSLDNPFLKFYHTYMTTSMKKVIKMQRTATRQRSVNDDIEKLVMIGARVRPSLHQRIKEFAFRNNMSIAYVLESAIKEYMDRYEEGSERIR